MPFNHYTNNHYGGSAFAPPGFSTEPGTSRCSPLFVELRGTSHPQRAAHPAACHVCFRSPQTALRIASFLPDQSSL